MGSHVLTIRTPTPRSVEKGFDVRLFPLGDPSSVSLGGDGHGVTGVGFHPAVRVSEVVIHVGIVKVDLELVDAVGHVDSPLAMSLVVGRSVQGVEELASLVLIEVDVGVEALGVVFACSLPAPLSDEKHLLLVGKLQESEVHSLRQERHWGSRAFRTNVVIDVLASVVG